MTKRNAILGTIIIFGSFLYVALLHHAMQHTPSEPTSPEIQIQCQTKYERTTRHVFHETLEELPIPTIYVVTPTYSRPEMLPELTRLGQTLLLVQKIHWIVTEDSHQCSQQISDFLEKLGLPFTHIASPMPDIYRRQKNPPRGVSNRRAALQWIKDRTKNGILYFLDDDNTINVDLFEEMRYTKKVSMWPVGLIGNYAVSSPVLNHDGVVVGFYDGWEAGRRFPVDMAGFAVNIEYMKKQKATMPYIAGYEEDGFLKSLNISLFDIEPKADRCTQIYVWHTRTKRNPQRSVNLKQHLTDNIFLLAKEMKLWAMIK